MPPPVTPIRPETQTPPVVKRGRGRPPAAPKEFDFSKTKQLFRSPAEFERFINAYPHQQAICGYWWRLKPKIDLGLIGSSQTNIAKVVDLAEMTREYAANRWGRGTYMVKFNDANLQGQQEVARCIFDVDEPDARSPVYDIATLMLNAPDNADEISRQVGLGVLERSPGGVVRIRAAERPAASPAAAVAPPAASPAPAPPPNSIELALSSMIPDLIHKALNPPAAPAPADPVQSMKAMFELFKSFQPAAVASPVAVAPVAGFEAELAAHSRVEEWLERIGAGRTRAEESPVWAETIKELVGPVMPLAVAWLSSKLGPGAGPQKPGERAAIAAATSTAELPAEPVEDFLPESAPLSDRIEEVANLALFKMEHGVPGRHFAAWLFGFYPGGPEVFGTLQKAGGPKGVIGFLAMMPRTQGFVTDTERAAALEAWLVDFFSYAPAESEQVAA